MKIGTVEVETELKKRLDAIMVLKVEHDMMSLYGVEDCENDDDYKIACATLSAFNEMARAMIREIGREQDDEEDKDDE